ncbi:MAG: hypothetical protein K2Y05_06465, partial [Hyphomicrobiaceae bacterium]|nr:hypothetical protein [Hyphomicrobiaceae bacterium]
MSKKSKVALPAGELFLLHDEREEADLLDQMRDPDPVFSAALAAENDRRMKALDPTFPYGLYENRAFECPAELIHPSTLVRGKQPKSLPHTDRMFNFANVDGTSSIHIVVSTEWKEVIEELELGTHQFYPHRLDFADGSSAQRFIMRDRAPVLHGLFVPKLTRITRGDIRSIRRGHEFDEQILAVFKAAGVDPGALPHPRLSYSHAIPPIEASSELSEGDL